MVCASLSSSLGATAAVLLLVAVAELRYSQGHPEANCSHAITEYLRCESKAQERRDGSFPIYQRFVKRVEDCFQKSGCIVTYELPGLPNELASAPKRCIAQLRQNAFNIQLKCWSESFDAPTSYLEPVILTTDLIEDPMIAFDRIVSVDYEEPYYLQRDLVLSALYELRNDTTCTQTEWTNLKQCVTVLFDEVAPHENVFARMLFAENRFNIFCVDHKACNDALTPNCRRQRDEIQNKFCDCLLPELYQQPMDEYFKCSGEGSARPVVPHICCSLCGETFCKKTFLDLLYETFDHGFSAVSESDFNDKLV